MKIVNQIFENVTDIAFPRRTSRSEIIQRASILAFLVLSGLAITFLGLTPLYAYFRYQNLGGAIPDPTLPIAGWIIYIPFVIWYIKAENLREQVGIACLKSIGLLYDAFSRGAIFVISHKGLSRPVGVIAFLVATALFARGHESRLNKKLFNEKLYENRKRIERFIDRRPIAENSASHARSLVAQYCEFQASVKTKDAVRDLGCARKIISTVAYLYKEQLEEEVIAGCVLDDIVRSRPAGAFDDRVAAAATYLGAQVCNADRRSELYRLVLVGRLHLQLAEQGRVLSETVVAHKLLNEAEKLQKELGADSGSIGNGLGNVFSHYIQNFDSIKAGYCWSDVSQVPDDSRNCDDMPRFVKVINFSIENLRIGRDLELQKDSDFAETRFENNRQDILLRLLGLIAEERLGFGPNGEDPLVGIDRDLKDDAVLLRHDAISWIRKSRRDGMIKLRRTDVLAVLITMAQLSSREIQILEKSNRHPPVGSTSAIVREERSGYEITGIGALQTAILMGFDNRSFFSHPSYMGMCPLALSPDQGSAYLQLVESLLELDSGIIVADCELADGGK